MDIFSCAEQANTKVGIIITDWIQARIKNGGVVKRPNGSIKRMKLNILKNKDGFTFAEMIVTVAILGTIISIAVPKFTELTFQSKIRKSETTIINIQQAFFTYYYNTSILGRGEFPPSPVDSQMTIEWSILPLLIKGTSVANLFRNGKIPLTPNKKPYIYFQLPPVPERGLTPGFRLSDTDYQLINTFRL